MDAPEEQLRTRCGYTPRECLQAFIRSLTETGAVSTGKTLHFAADLICSGGVELFLEEIWNYAIHHIGIASPRIFVYLKKRTDELDKLIKKLPEDLLFSSEEFQTRVGEIILVVRDAPCRSPIPWPKVGPETHTTTWLTGLNSAPETEAIRRVWKQEGDMPLLKTVGCELVAAIGSGASEKALFWIRWLFDEEKKVKAETKGATMTTVDRANGGGRATARSVGHFIAALFAESYKEFARKELVRMHEEFQTLLDLWRGAEKRIGGGSRKYILGLLAIILCEVPRWKVPAAPTLIKDPVLISRTVGQSRRFFEEVLVYPKPMTTTLVKLFRIRGSMNDKQKDKLKTVTAQQQKIDTMDALFSAYIGGT
jgi:hypothetical protein